MNVLVSKKLTSVHNITKCHRTYYTGHTFRSSSELCPHFRACFKSLPKVLCFNTMRYTFNMVTMMKEKVNTHFSFPMKLNMAAYTEEYLLKRKGEGGQ